MKKIFLYICMICLAGLSTYAAINGTQANDDTFATNALKEGSFPLTFEQESTTAPWTTAGNGVVTSSNKEANSEVGFSTTFNLSFDATVSFDWSVNGDQLIFYVDNKQVTNISGIISNYTPYSYDLKTGVHTLKWSYKNSSSATTGDDRGYVKNIYMSPTSFIMPGVAYPVCETQLYFGNVVKNAPTTVNLNVRNIGSEQLNITKVTTDNTIFSIGDYEKNIPALETRTIPFTVTVTAEGLIEAKAIIVTNGGTREVSLRANCTSDITSIAVTSPGNLSNQVSASDYAKINNLKLTGVINDTDIAFIKQNLTAVKTLDLLDASFINNSINTQFQKNTWVTLILPKGTLTINSAALQESEWLQSIVLPEGLTDINSNAFYKCSSLQNIVLPSTLRTIGIRAFNDCASLKAITIPDRVESIEQYVFFYCNLETVVLGNQVTTIGNSAFANCKSLQTINMPETLTTIGNSAFSGCSKLASIYIPESVNKIENYAFSNSGLRTFTLPQNITIIPNYVFNNCDSLRTITLTPQLTAIEEDAFNSCDSVKDITINNENETIIATAGKFASIQKVTFGDLVTAIPDNLFKDKKYLKEVKFGKELATIGANAFYNTGLEKFTLPDQVTTIGEAAFKGNKQLTEFTLSKSINEIPTEAFAGCIKLDSIGFPASIRKVGSKAFDGCDSLRVIELNPELTEIGEYAFYNAGDKKLESITIPAKVKSIGSYAFASCDTLSNITLGEAVDSIATYAFQKCRCLKAITLPAKLRKLEHDVFNGTEIASLNIPDQVTDVTGVFNGLNSKLTSVTLGNGIKALPEGIFNSFSALQSVRIGTGVTKLPSNTFYYCKALTDVTIGANVTTLDAYSFGYCTALKQLSIPEKVTDIHENAFYGTALTDLALNMEEIKDYAFNNRTDLTQITIGKNVKRIGVQAFGYTNITNITLPENLTTIAEKAFYGTKLQNIRIPASVKTVGSQAFYNCKELQSVEIAAGSVSIGKQAFQASPKLTTVIMKEGGEKNIATEAFYNCPALEQVTLASTDSIGTRAFSNCPKLASIHIPAKTIGAYAFANCSTLTDVTFAEGMDSIADYAFVNSTNINRVALPNSLRTIGAYAFSAENKENSLRSISFGNNLETIGKNAFYKSTQVKDIVIPDKVKTIRLNAFSNCENLRTVSVGSGVVTVEPFAFNANPNLMSITWNSKTRIENDAFNSYAKNCLMYVTAQTEVPQKWYNVIRDGVAENIEIADKYPFHCWKAFEAKKAIFRKTFSLETGRGNVSKGWESITLPFDVSRIWFESKSTELLPFGAEGASTRRFWLRELGENGFQSCQQIKAHTPYIIAMPNNREYDEQYNITGEVQFIAEDYRIPVTPEVLPIVEGPKFNFVPTLTAVEQSQEVYALNIDPYNTEETTGSVFERYRRDVKPFEAYVTDKPGSLNAPLMFSIGDNGGGATDIRITLGETIDNVKAYSRNGILYIESDCTRTIEIYGVNGMLLRNAEVNEGINQVTDLDEGVYFLEGQKVIVKQ